MGHISNQWLQGITERNTSNSPIPSIVTVHETSNSWAKKNAVVAMIRAQRIDNDSGDYQCLYLNDMDMDTVLPTLIDIASGKNPRLYAMGVLDKLNDADFLSCISEVLRRRLSAKGKSLRLRK